MSDAIDSQHETMSTEGTTSQVMGGMDPVVTGFISHGTYSARVIAHQHGSGTNRATWNVSFAFYVDDTGAITITGGLQTLLHQTSGLVAATWTVAETINQDRLWITVTGSAGLTVDWGLAYDVYWVYED